MHGRVKVKTSQEQAEAKKKERLQKLEKFRQLTDTIYTKRDAGELDSEMLQLTQKVLSADPDYYTLWNIRRETMDVLAQPNSDEIREMLTRELHFLESCLKVNPKSYSAFLQRRWVMTKHPSPDWTSELSLCNTFLQYDERNFHCWDYRRFVVKHGKFSMQEELAFTESKIKANFSNYSAWHYRSKLLPKLCPDPSSTGRPTEDALVQEYRYVQNAFFTDPSDQSAWFYHRWLLGRMGLSCHITCAHVIAANSPELVLSVSTCQPLKVPNQTLIVTVNGVTNDCLWQSLGDPAGWPSSFWSTTVPVPGSAKWPLGIEIQKDDQNLVLSVSDTVVGSREAWCFDRKVADRNLSQLTAATSAVLQEELESCQQLVELEPDNKWVLLTTVFLMQCLDMELHHLAIISYLDKLKAIDPYRQGYFHELKSYFLVEKQIRRFQQQLAVSDKPEQRNLSLSNMGFGRLMGTHQLFLVTELDISHNQLCDLRGCQYLQCLEHLNADDNRLERIGCSLDHLPRLTWVSLCNNRLLSMTSLDGLLGLNLVALLLQGNALLDLDVKLQLSEILPSTRFD